MDCTLAPTAPAVHMLSLDSQSHCIKRVMLVVSSSALLCACEYSNAAIPEAFKQKLYVVAANEVATHERSIQVETSVANNIEVKTYPIEQYRSGEELIRDNPNCCIVGATPGDHKPPKCFGERFYVVTIEFRSRYHDKSGAAREAKRVRAIGVTRKLKICSSPYWR